MKLLEGHQLWVEAIRNGNVQSMLFREWQLMIYLDHHATTPVLPEAWDAMRPFMAENFGNPSSSHAFGRKARQSLEDARERIAHLLDAYPDEVIFTSGATEANNLAIFGLAGDPPGHALGSMIEHPCVVEPLRQLERRGFDVEWLPVQQNGSIAVEDLVSRIRPETRLVCLMLVNHETGALQPVAESAFRLPPSAFLHTDAAQAVGKRPVRFHELGASSLSASGHKFGAPKGIGLLLLRRGTTLRPQLWGGHQQHGRRPGTEPVALIVALATALEVNIVRLAASQSRVVDLRECFIKRLNAELQSLVLNSPESGSPYVANISFLRCRADLLLMKLDLAGVACSTGSACSSGSLLPSPVLQAMQLSDELLRSALRFSFNSCLSDQQIDQACNRIVKAVNELRQDDPSAESP